MKQTSSQPASKAVRRRRRPAISDPTREKLLDAAGRIFADRGYQAATVREICDAAGENVAAIHYHFGDKLGLYTQVVQQSMQAAEIEGIRNALNLDSPPQDVLRAVIRARLRSIERGDRPDWHFRILIHEMAQPTPVLRQLINEVGTPLFQRLLMVIGGMIGLPPDNDKTRMCALSVMGQILAYVFATPLLAGVWPELKMTPDQVDRIADHIADFSLSSYIQTYRSRSIASNPAPPRTSTETEAKQMTTSTPLSPTQAPQPADVDNVKTSAPPAESSNPPTTRRRKPLILFAIVVAAIAAVVIWRAFFAAPALPDSIVAVSGRIEGDDSAVASKTTGRILEVRVREGDTVNAGDIIAILDDAQIQAREDQARAALSAAQAKGEGAREQIAVLQQQLDQSQLQVGQSKLDTAGHVKQAEADLAAAQSDLAQQQAAYNLAAFDKDAYTRLAKSGAVSERQGLQAASTADQQAAAVAAAQRRVQAAQAELTTAQATQSNPGIRQSQVALVHSQIAQQQAEVASAAAQTQQAQAQLVEAEDNRNDLTIRAPFSGTVVTRAAEPGEMMTAGTAIITLLDLTKIYLRGFVPEGQIGEVKVGQSAHIYLDSDPKKPVDAYVSRIDPEATFTPENTYFQSDRVKQVVGIKLQLKAGFGFAKPGMPADGEVLVKGDTWPKVSR